MSKRGMKLVKLARSFQRRNRSPSSYNVLLLRLSCSNEEDSDQHQPLSRFYSDEVSNRSNEILEVVAAVMLDNGTPESSKQNKIRLLDPPGLMDPGEDCGKDSQILVNIARFYRRKGYFPHCIVFCLNLEDSRTEGMSFLRMLQLMRLHLRSYVIDPRHPNLICVLSHPDDREDCATTAARIKKMIVENLVITTCPVVLHNISNFESTDLFPLDPSYLSAATENVSAEERPLLNLLTLISTSLSSPEVRFRTTKHPIEELCISMESPSSDLGTVQPDDRHSLAEMLSLGWSELKPREQRSARLKPDELAQKLHRLGHSAPTDLPRTVRATMILFRKLDPDRPMEAMLRKVGLEAPRFPVDFLLGSGYNITTDREATFNVIDLGPYKLSDIGVSLPSNVIAHEHPEVRYICKIAQSMEKLQKERLIELGFSIELPLVVGFNYGYRSGYNLLSGSALQKLTSVYEKRLLMLEIRPDAPLTKELRRAVTELPKKYDSSDIGNVQAWITFFNRFGTHYVSRAYVGGSITFDIVTSRKEENISSFSEHDAGLSGIIQAVIASGRGNLSSSKRATSTSAAHKMNCNAAGGNSNVVRELWTSSSEEEFLERLKWWEETIWENPIVSDMSITLGEITDLLYNVDSDVATATRNALQDLYKGQLRVQTSSETTDAASAHDRSADEDTSLHPKRVGHKDCFLI